MRLFAAQSNLTDVEVVKEDCAAPAVHSGARPIRRLTWHSRMDEIDGGSSGSLPCIALLVCRKTPSNMFSMTGIVDHGRSIPTVFAKRTAPVPNQYREIVSIDRLARSFAQRPPLVLPYRLRFVQEYPLPPTVQG